MSVLASIRPVFTLALAGAAVVLSAAGPAQAAGDKPIKITLPASAIKDDTSRVCMPRTVLGRKAVKTLPATICETQSEWGVRGVTIVTK